MLAAQSNEPARRGADDATRAALRPKASDTGAQPRAPAAPPTTKLLTQADLADIPSPKSDAIALSGMFMTPLWYPNWTLAMQMQRAARINRGDHEEDGGGLPEGWILLSPSAAPAVQWTKVNTCVSVQLGVHA